MDPFFEAAVVEAEPSLAEGGIPSGVMVEVLQDMRCVELMRPFIRERPELWNEDIGV